MISPRPWKFLVKMDSLFDIRLTQKEGSVGLSSSFSVGASKGRKGSPRTRLDHPSLSKQRPHTSVPGAGRLSEGLETVSLCGSSQACRKDVTQTGIIHTAKRK